MAGGQEAATLAVALVEAGPLTPERDAGARADVDLLDGLRRLGHRPSVFYENVSGFYERLGTFGPDVVVCSRPAVMVRHGSALRRLGVPIVFLGHDLHHRRLAAQRQFDPTVSPAAPRIMRAVEERCWELADWSVYPDPVEAEEVLSRLGGDGAGYFPYYLVDDLPLAPPADGTDLFFVGGSAHGPNRDGIAWLLTEIWPGLTARIPGVGLVVCGRWQPEELPGVVPPGVRFVGALPEAEMLARMRACAGAVAPLRYGAGVKRKVVQYLAGGMPTVTTPVGCQGLVPRTGAPEPFLVEATEQGWVDALTRVLSDPGLRASLSAAGRALVQSRYGERAYLQALGAVLAAAARVHTAKARRG